ARVDLNGRIEDVKQPNFNIGSLFSNLASYPSNIYNVRDGANWSGTALYPNNPVASVNALGFYNTHNRILQGNFGLKEKLDFITPGLYLDEAYSFNSYAQTLYGKSASYARYFNGATTTTDQNSPLRAFNQSAQQQQDWKQLMVTAGYERDFGDHQITSALNYHQSDFRGDGDFSFAYHYQNISGRANYAYKGKYIAELGFSYFGTDAYAPGNRWGFYPSISGAWIVSEESFLKGSETVGLFKLRASVGKLGSADTEGTGISIGGLNGRYLYQQYYSGSGTFYVGNDGTPAGQTGISPVFIANKNIFAEKSIKYNIGADLTLFSKLNLQLDAFMDKRSDIIYPDYSIPASFGNNVLVKNLGKLTNKGFEASAVFTDKPGKVGYTLTAMAAYNKNTIDYMAETAVAYPYNALTGRSYGTRIGLVSTGYYQLSDFNANGTLKSGIPVPAFGSVQPGDLRYQDLDNNGTVDDNDRTKIGNGGYPKLTYAFGASINYAGFDLTAFLQGTYGSTVDILNSASSQTQAFVGNGNAYAIAQGAWAYYPDQGIDTRASATYPRLTTNTNTNNYRTSSFWIKSGDFLRIRNLELGYSFSTNTIQKIGMRKLRIFVNAVNPVTWSSLLKDYHMDPETLSGYPALKSFNTGISVTF
ncbi:MAG: SusC/RagA family TonB-linked outer membrane protein, partial [Pedobacter sp.]